MLRCLLTPASCDHPYVDYAGALFLNQRIAAKRSHKSPAFCQVKERVYPLVDALLKRVTGATRTLIFDHTLRNGHIK